MAIQHDQLPRELEALPEPARTKAVETANALLETGMPRREAIEKAVAMAAQWIDERAPGDRTREREEIHRR